MPKQATPVQAVQVRAVQVQAMPLQAMPVQAQVQIAAPVPVQLTSQQTSERTLRAIFASRVMCDFTPRSPRTLPTWRWATLEQLLDRLQRHAPTEVWHLGPNSLRQLITEWYKDHPAFAGLAFSAWGKRLKDTDPQAHPRSLVFKFSFEHTPLEELANELTRHTQ